MPDQISPTPGDNKVYDDVKNPTQVIPDATSRPLVQNIATPLPDPMLNNDAQPAEDKPEDKNEAVPITVKTMPSNAPNNPLQTPPVEKTKSWALLITIGLIIILILVAVTLILVSKGKSSSYY